MSDFANVMFTNVLGCFAKAKSRFANVPLVTAFSFWNPGGGGDKVIWKKTNAY